LRKVGVGLLKLLELGGFHEENGARGGGKRMPDVVEKVYF
jgi:hypothetical protein